MDIKQYIDYFDELSHLKRDMQFKFLEQVRNDIHKNYKFPILTFLPYLIRLTFVLLFTGGSYFTFGFSSWILVLSLFLGLISSKIAITEINDSIILKTIKKKLNNETV